MWKVENHVTWNLLCLRWLKAELDTQRIQRMLCLNFESFQTLEYRPLIGFLLTKTLQQYFFEKGVVLISGCWCFSLISCFNTRFCFSNQKVIKKWMLAWYVKMWNQWENDFNYTNVPVALRHQWMSNIYVQSGAVLS